MQVALKQSIHNTMGEPQPKARLLARVWEYQNQLGHLFLSFFSPKQLTRPDSIFACCREVFPYIKQSFAEQCWKIVFIVKRYLYLAKDDFLSTSLIALEAINDLEKTLSNDDLTQITISDEKAKSIQFFLSQSLSDREYVKINAYLSFLGNNKLWRTLKACKELFLPIQQNCIKTLHTKMLNISKTLNEPIEAYFNSEYKLTSEDLRLLIVAESRRKLMMILNKNGIDCYCAQKLHDEWEGVEKLNNCEVMNIIRNRCENGYKPGQIYFYDWHFIEIRDFYPLGLEWAFKHVLYSRIPHLGIIINDDHNKNKPKLSHVNGAMGTHGFHPIGFPILGALGNFGELDILPLIPANVIPEHHNRLKKCFSDAFIQFASEIHPEVKFELKPTCFLGHKGLFAQKLSNVDFSSKESHFCSSYVGVVFLKAVNEVNKHLSVLGYQEKIPHPFGEHEILNRIDTLRLIYHWKQLKVLNVVSLDAFVDKVFAAPRL